jgi:VIT1/CCC1 family predicted Fe2+/Mn2+ transporter
MPARRIERHRGERGGWLRAAVPGGNDGILSTSSLVLGVAAARATHHEVPVAGEYVSVHSQADTERADLELQRAKLSTDDGGERQELTAIYVARGIDTTLAGQVAEQLMAHDALGAHARDELGIIAAFRARPIQAALASAASFVAGAAMPLAVTAVAPRTGLISVVSGTSLFFPGASGRVGRGRRERGCGAGRNARHVLGRAGYGCDCGRWSTVRSRYNWDLRSQGNLQQLPD